MCILIFGKSQNRPYLMNTEHHCSIAGDNWIRFGHRQIQLFYYIAKGVIMRGIFSNPGEQKCIDSY